jgi:membrane protease YdiL (CAAX protease family)
MMFYVLAFGIAWSMWALAGRFTDGATLTATGHLIFLTGVFAPGISAVSIAATKGGGADVRALFRQIARFKVPAKYYAFAAGYMAVVKLTAAVLIRVSSGAWPAFGTDPIALIIGALIVSTWTQAGEELGWRALALPRLAARMGMGPASIVLGVIWALWHLPLFYAPYSDTVGQSFPLYLSQVTALSVAMGWLYWRTRGSLFLVMLLHAAVNNTANIVPSRIAGATEAMSFHASAVGWTTAGILWAVAALLVYDMRGSAKPESQQLAWAPGRMSSSRLQEPAL